VTPDAVLERAVSSGAPSPPACGHRRRNALGAPARVPQVFQSFWQGGFESACHVNRDGMRLDMLASTHHDLDVDADYARLADLGMRTCRDGVRWPLIERNGTFDFSSLRPFVEASLRRDMQVVWTLCHYGWPDDVDVFSAGFPARFARFAAAVARFIQDHDGRVPFYVPVNEISFLAWAAGDEGYMFPYARGCATRLKRQLVSAAVAAMAAIRDVDPRARFVHTEPLIHVMAPRDRPELAPAAAAKCEGQFEAWEALAGRHWPELGGAPGALDVLGVNFYHANQWEHDESEERRERRLRWEDHPRDPRWVPLSSLLADVYDRYRRPLVVSETSHFGAGRAAWLEEIAEEVARARAMGVPVEGVCLYPVIDRHDWDDPEHWHHSGLWDMRRGEDGRWHRHVNAAYARALDAARRRVG
jgi:beta-glucosidase/6-phospho-beta-glucosidase/beta-galactosidase